MPAKTRQQRLGAIEAPRRYPPLAPPFQGGEYLLARSAGEHRAEGLAGEDVDVEVGDFLPAIDADIGEQAIAGSDESLVASDAADGADEGSDLVVRPALGEIVPRNV